MICTENSGMILTSHRFDVPLDYGSPDKGSISVFAREVVAKDKHDSESLPWMVFFQGGPGFESPRPLSKNSWLKRVLRDYRVLLLDQRGTGLSTPFERSTLSGFSSAEAAADYLSCFRADSIVNDAEHIRKELVGSESKWTAFGQSFGGFCITHYLSAAPEGLAGAIVCGGLPPVGKGPDEVYRSLYKRCILRNEEYYSRYPADVEAVRGIYDYLDRNETRLPSGGILTPRRLQLLGWGFGMHQGYEHVHYLIERAFLETKQGAVLSHYFLNGIERALEYGINPLYLLLHEAIYCEEASSNWSAHRVRSEFQQFSGVCDGKVYFTSEMVYPWMFDDFSELEAFKEVGELLASRTWPKLYNEEVLASSTVPVVAAVYANDLYVEREFSEGLAAIIPGSKVWLTSEYEHNGYNHDGERVLGRLLDMLGGEVDV